MLFGDVSWCLSFIAFPDDVVFVQVPAVCDVHAGQRSGVSVWSTLECQSGAGVRIQGDNRETVGFKNTHFGNEVFAQQFRGVM